MNPNNRNCIAKGAGVLVVSGRRQSCTEPTDFTKRIEAFERRALGSNGMAKVLQVAAADLLRNIPLLETAVIDQLKEIPGHPCAGSRSAPSRYMGTLRVLRQTLEASVIVESRTQPGAQTR